METQEDTHPFEGMGDLNIKEALEWSIVISPCYYTNLNIF